MSECTWLYGDLSYSYSCQELVTVRSVFSRSSDIVLHIIRSGCKGFTGTIRWQGHVHLWQPLSGASFNFLLVPHRMSPVCYTEYKQGYKFRSVDASPPRADNWLLCALLLVFMLQTLLQRRPKWYRATACRYSRVLWYGPAGETSASGPASELARSCVPVVAVQ